MFASMAIMQANPDVGAIILSVAIPLVLIGLLAFFLALGLILTPLYIRGGLTQDFALTFNFRWVGDFVKRMWVETLLVNLFAWLASVILLLLGCALFCIGALVAGSIMTLASGHLNWQLYELYLARGGEPIPLKPPAGVTSEIYPTSPKSSASP
jgi:hypothetical protein